MNPKGAKAAVAARNKAAQTPDEVRRAFLGKRHEVAGLTLAPFSLDVLWMLEEIEHPEMVASAGGPARTVTVADTARAIFIFADLDNALAASQVDRATFDAEAHRFARQVKPSDLPALQKAMREIINEGLATIPGAGIANPPTAG